MAGDEGAPLAPSLRYYRVVVYPRRDEEFESVSERLDRVGLHASLLVDFGDMYLYAIEVLDDVFVRRRLRDHEIDCTFFADEEAYQDFMRIAFENRVGGYARTTSATLVGPSRPVVHSSTDTSSSSKLAFLCHSSEDKAAVRELRRRLVGDDVNCWLDEANLLPGQTWSYEIEQAIGRASHVVAFLSRDSVTKTGYVNREMKLALDCAAERPEGTIFLIPARLEPCPLPARLRDLHVVDLFEPDGYDFLLRALKHEAAHH